MTPIADSVDDVSEQLTCISDELAPGERVAHGPACALTCLNVAVHVAQILKLTEHGASSCISESGTLCDLGAGGGGVCCQVAQCFHPGGRSDRFARLRPTCRLYPGFPRTV